MQDDERGYERFDLDNEFEGGEWVDGEFVYAREKKRRKMTKDERLYGAFAEDSEGQLEEEADEPDYDSSDDEGRRSRGLGGGKGREGPGRTGRGLSDTGRGRGRGGRSGAGGRADYARPVSFVAKGVYGGDRSSEQEGQEDSPPARGGLGAGAREDRRGEEPARGGLGGLGMGSARGGLGLGAASSGHAPHSYQEEEEDAVLPSAFGRQVRQRAQQKLQVKAKEADRAAADREAREGIKEMASFERFTKGIGSKLLLKMGFKPGEGLGKDRKGMAKPLEVKMRPKNMGMGFNDFQEAGALNRKEPPPDEAVAPGPKPADETDADIQRARDAQRKAWKKTPAAPKVKREYRTAEDLLRERQAAPAPMAVIDMRGGEARLVAAGEDGRLSTGDLAPRTRPAPMPELQHNLALLVDLTEAEIRRLDVQGRTDRDTLEALAAEEGRLREAAAEYQGALSRMQRLGDLVASVSPRADGTVPALAEMEAALKEALAVYRDEYREYGLANIAACRVHPHLRHAFSGWDPFAEPARGVHVLQPWKALLAPNGIEEAGSPLGALLEDLLIPPLRPAITTRWDPREPEPLVALLEAWEPLLPRDLMGRVLEHLVLPRLRAAVDAWEPRSDPVPVHAWLHPWLPLLLHRLEPLYAPIRHKLAVALQHWHPSDGSAMLVVAPWRPVWGKKEWDAFCARCIAPKLQAMLQQELVINPAHQDLAPLESVTAWAGCLSDALLASVLEQGLFPQWHAVLQHWLAAGGDRDEITRWFLGWRALLPQDLLAHDKIRAQLNAGLNAINAGPEAAHPQHKPWTRELNQQQQTRAAPSSAATAAPAPIPDLFGPEASLLELVQTFAANHDLEFVPRSRNQFGQQIYRLGSVSVVLDNAAQVLRAQMTQQADAPWQLASLEEIVAEHGRRTATSAGAKRGGRNN